MDKLEKAIFSTLCYFDIHNYPLTLFEIYKWLYIDDCEVHSLGRIKERLESGELSHLVGLKSGYYYLLASEKIVADRQRRYVISAHKSKIAQRAAKIFSYVPFVESVCACNDFGFNSLDKKSDIDLFVIAKSQRIYFVRLALIAIIMILRLRPKRTDKSDKICLSFFITDSDLNLDSVMIGENDIYLTYWLATLYPFFGFKKYLELLNANARILSKLPNCQIFNPCHERKIKFPVIFRLKIESLPVVLFNYLERAARKMQMKKINRKLDKYAGESTGIVISDRMLKFHENDNRRFYQDEFLKRVQNYSPSAYRPMLVGDKLMIPKIYETA